MEIGQMAPVRAGVVSISFDLQCPFLLLIKAFPAAVPECRATKAAGATRSIEERRESNNAQVP
eukprot:774399-Amphidinium_carterae.1